MEEKSEDTQYQSNVENNPTIPPVKKPVVKKKMTKKQRAAAAKALEEKRKAEEKEREARERELMMKADSESRAYEREVKYQLEEKERRDWEQNEMNHWNSRLEKSREEWKRRIKEQNQWKKYLKGNRTVNVRVEAELNTWVNLWKERGQLNMEEELSLCQEAEEIVRDMELLVAENFQTIGNDSRWISDIDRIRSLQLEKIDQLTAHIIRMADEHANAKNEVLLQHKTKDIKFGLWVNISKNPRIKRIDFFSLALSTDVSKNLALTSVAVRMMHFGSDPISYKYPSEYSSLGGLLILEILSLPPPPKKVKGWTLRQVSSNNSTVNRLPYPPPVGLGVEAAASVVNPQSSSGWPPLRITYMLPANIIVRDNSPIIGWWDAETKSWKTSGITEIEFDPPTKTIVFKTVHATALSIIQHRYLDFPYTRWDIRPSGKNEAILSVTTRCKKEIQIKIGEGYCRLYRCRDRELRELEDVKFSPAGLLKKLASCGINIFPDEHCYSYLKDTVSPKDHQLERKLYGDIACMVSSFTFKYSKWNNQKNSERKFIFQAKETLVWGEIEEEEADKENQMNASNDPSNNTNARDVDANGVEESECEEDSIWKTCLYQERSCILIKAGEKSSKYNEDLSDGAKIHQHLYHCLMSQKSGIEAERRVKGASIAFIETVQEVLNLIRVLSCSK